MGFVAVGHVWQVVSAAHQNGSTVLNYGMTSRVYFCKQLQSQFLTYLTKKLINFTKHHITIPGTSPIVIGLNVDQGWVQIGWPRRVGQHIQPLAPIPLNLAKTQPSG